MADEGFGTLMTFGTTTAFVAEIIGVSRSGYERKAIDTTHMTTTSGWRTMIPSDIKSAGTVTMSILYDPDLDVPIDQPIEAITITYPIPAGQSAGATTVCDGFIISSDNEAPLEDRMTATVVVQFTGVPVDTPSS